MINATNRTYTLLDVLALWWRWLTTGSVTRASRPRTNLVLQPNARAKPSGGDRIFPIAPERASYFYRAADAEV